jgi:hypothetical protein
MHKIARQKYAWSPNFSMKASDKSQRKQKARAIQGAGFLFGTGA